MGAIVGCTGALATLIGGLIYLLTLMFRIGQLITKLEQSVLVLDQKVIKLFSVFPKIEEHGTRLTRIETRMDIEVPMHKANGHWGDE